MDLGYGVVIRTRGKIAMDSRGARFGRKKIPHSWLRNVGSITLALEQYHS